MSLHPLDTRRYTEIAALASTAVRKFIQATNLLIEELEYRKLKRTEIKYFKANSEKEACSLAVDQGWIVLSAELVKDEQWKVTVLV